MGGFYPEPPRKDRELQREEKGLLEAGCRLRPPLGSLRWTERSGGLPKKEQTQLRNYEAYSQGSRMPWEEPLLSLTRFYKKKTGKSSMEKRHKKQLG